MLLDYTSVIFWSYIYTHHYFLQYQYKWSEKIQESNMNQKGRCAKQNCWALPCSFFKHHIHKSPFLNLFYLHLLLTSPNTHWLANHDHHTAYTFFTEPLIWPLCLNTHWSATWNKDLQVDLLMVSMTCSCGKPKGSSQTTATDAPIILIWRNQMLRSSEALAGRIWV